MVVHTSDPPSGNPRTVALGQHRIERAVQLWRNGAQLAKSMPTPRRDDYQQAVAAVLPVLAACKDIPSLIVSYYRGETGPHIAVQQACLGTSGRLPLNRGIVEDAAYYARYQQIVVASAASRG